MRGAIGSRSTLIDHEGRQFLMMDSPSDANIQEYVQFLQSIGSTIVARACEPSYDTKPFEDAGIHVHELPFTDGEPPPPEIVTKWLELLEIQQQQKTTIAVHCVAGLGRTPVLVAIALIEAGMDSYDAIELIRKKRRGSINIPQLKFLESYKRRSSPGGCCVIL
jgi:protein tyrosine phosphatase type 4A